MKATTTRRFTVRGHDVRTRTPRRYAVVVVRPIEYRDGDHVYVAFAEVRRRTDALDVARRAVRRYGRVFGAFAVVVDLTTGEEIA